MTFAIHIPVRSHVLRYLISSGEFKYLQYAKDSEHTYNQTAIDYILRNI